MKRNKGLGRGLDALLGGDNTPTAASTGFLPLDQLRPGKYQPRTRMNSEALRELAESIKAQGVMQPVLVRSVGDGYEIIAGERRVRAASIAGLHEVPVIIKQVPDNAALAMALIENIQREDLNPLEEAHGVQRLIREFDFTHEQAAQAIGRSRSATSNLLRLTNLAAPVQQMVLDGKLDMGHARALLALRRRAADSTGQPHCGRTAFSPRNRSTGRARRRGKSSQDIEKDAGTRPRHRSPRGRTGRHAGCRRATARRCARQRRTDDQICEPGSA